MSAAIRTATFGHAAARPGRRGGILDLLLDMIAISAQRRQLAQLDPALLRDIGLTPDQAWREAMRLPWDRGQPVLWDAPCHWIRRHHG